MSFDYIIVGAGLFGSALARLMTDAGKACLVVENGDIGGMCASEDVNGIDVHKHGAHIFRTNDDEIWRFVNTYAEFNRFTNSPIANYNGVLYNLPFNMNTFNQLWGVNTPAEAREEIERQRVECKNPQNLEEHALALVGRDIYEKLIKEYTEKQWGKKCTELPPETIRRIPLRFTFDNNYYNARFQGVPAGGFKALFARMLNNIPVLHARYDLSFPQAGKVVYTGAVDKLYGYAYGHLQYRGLKFIHKALDIDNYQGVAVMNFTGKEPYTRIIEHKHFQFGEQPNTVITYEYPQEWKPGDIPYYPMEDEKNKEIYAKYREVAEGDGIILGGRLGEYKYYDMQETIRSAMELAKRELMRC